MCTLWIFWERVQHSTQKETPFSQRMCTCCAVVQSQLLTGRPERVFGQEESWLGGFTPPEIDKLKRHAVTGRGGRCPSLHALGPGRHSTLKLKSASRVHFLGHKRMKTAPKQSKYAISQYWLDTSRRYMVIKTEIGGILSWSKKCHNVHRCPIVSQLQPQTWKHWSVPPPNLKI